MKLALTLAIILGILVAIAAFNTSNNVDLGECTIDSDCVPSTCCHPNECVLKEQAPNCDGIYCTLSCDTLLDCGAGKCACNNGNCTVELVKQTT